MSLRFLGVGLLSAGTLLACTELAGVRTIELAAGPSGQGSGGPGSGGSGQGSGGLGGEGGGQGGGQGGGGDAGTCMKDKECPSGMLCIDAACQVASCHPKPASTTECAPPAICCPAPEQQSAGLCVAAPAGMTVCCDDEDCKAQPPTTSGCTTDHTCGCPKPPPGTLFVSPFGSDADTLYLGNGSEACPLKTIGKAIAKAGASPTTIVLMFDDNADQTFYGTGLAGEPCTGGTPCDQTPITIPAASSGGLTIRASTPKRVTVAGPGDQVFLVNAKRVGFENLSIVPTKPAIVGGPKDDGGIGILYDAVGSASPPVIRNVDFDMSLTLAGGAEGGTAIDVRGAANPRIGPGVTIVGGYYGIHVQDSATPTIVGEEGSPTTLSGMVRTGIEVLSTLDPPPSISLTSRGAATPQIEIFMPAASGGGISIDAAFAGANSTIEGVRLLKSSGGASTWSCINLKKQASLTLSDSSLEGPCRGVQLDGNASLAASNLWMSGNWTGVDLRDSSSATLENVTINESVDDGLSCDDQASLLMRGSNILASGGIGARIVNGCKANLGSPGDPGNNVFNRTSQKNGRAAICFGPFAGTLHISSSTFSCGHTGQTCAAGTPTRKPQGPTFSCDGDYDLAESSAGIVELSSPTCCN